jgi:hypothetical protein
LDASVRHRTDSRFAEEGTSSSAWCPVRTPNRARPAGAASSTCAATAATPSTASRRSTGSAEQWTIEADYAVKLDPRLELVGILMEPASIVAKAWDHIDRIGNRAYFAPERVLVTAVAVGVYCFRATPVDHRTHPGIAAWVAFAGAAVIATLVTAGLVHRRHIRA